MFVEAPVLDGFDAQAQQRGHIVRRQNDAVLAVDGKHIADQERIEAEHGQLGAIGLPKTDDRVAARMDRYDFRLPDLVYKAHAARMEIEVAAVSAVHAGPRGRIAAAVVEAAQLLFELVGRHPSTGVKIEGLGVHARRHRPQATLEIPGYDAVEIHGPDCSEDHQRCERDAHDDEQLAQTMRLGAGHVGAQLRERENTRLKARQSLPR